MIGQLRRQRVDCIKVFLVAELAVKTLQHLARIDVIDIEVI